MTVVGGHNVTWVVPELPWVGWDVGTCRLVAKSMWDWGRRTPRDIVG